MPQTSQRGCPGVEVATLCLRNFLVLAKLMSHTSQREHPAGDEQHAREVQRRRARAGEAQEPAADGGRGQTAGDDGDVEAGVRRHQRPEVAGGAGDLALPGGAVVGQEQDDRVLGDAELVERVEQAADKQ